MKMVNHPNRKRMFRELNRFPGDQAMELLVDGWAGLRAGSVVTPSSAGMGWIDGLGRVHVMRVIHNGKRVVGPCYYSDFIRLQKSNNVVS